MTTRSETPTLAPTAPEPERNVLPAPEVPAEIFLNDYHDLDTATLYEMAQKLQLRSPGNSSKFELIHDILSLCARRGSRIEAEGVLDLANGAGFGFLRWPRYSFSPTADSIYVSPGIVRRFGLEPGALLRGTVGMPRQKEKYLALADVRTIEGTDAETWEPRTPFDRLTPLFPKDRILLENKELQCVSTRVVDLVAPLGKGQRGLIVAPPRSGKTILLKQIAQAIHANHPEIELMIVLVDERPEEVTDFRETVQASVYSSTFDESPQRHIQVAEIVIERAKRLVEMGRDVVILLDSLTRLTRGYNAIRGNSGRTGSGGVDAKALQKARRFFSAARNIEEGGSLTILASALIETENRMDEVIFEEFKGTGNLEIQLDRELMEHRIFPAIHLLKSGTRKDELLYHADEFPKVSLLRKQMAQVPMIEAMVKLVRTIGKTSTNAELLLAGLK